MKQNPYTATDSGCYVDNARGIYATDAIIAFANDHGANITHDPGCHSIDCAATTIDATFATCEWVGEYEDRADDWMNDHFPVDGCSWGRQDGDWGLWSFEDED
jgi:hypothetical protein